MDLFAAEIGMDAAEVRRRNLLAAGRSSRSPPRAARTTTAASTPRRIDTVLEAADYAGLRAEQKARRERGDVVQLGHRASRCFVEITGGGAFTEDATVEVHPDGTVTVLTGTSPHGQGHATAWAMLASEHLGIPIDKITVKHGDTDLIPRGRRHDGLAQPADRRRRGLPGGRRAGGAGQAAGGRPARGQRRRPRGRRRHGRGERHRHRHHAGPAGRAGAAAGRHALRQRRADVPVRRAPGRRRAGRRVRQGGRRQDHHRRRRRHRSSTRCSPRASGTAASPRASRRRCSRRSSTTRTATR